MDAWHLVTSDAVMHSRNMERKQFVNGKILMKNAIQSTLRRVPRAVLSTALVAVLTGMALAARQGDKEETAAPARKAAVTLAVDERAINREGKTLTSFSPVVKKVAPSVVRVFTSTKPKYSSTQEVPGFDNPFFRRFFGDEMEEGMPGAPNRRRGFRPPAQHGMGSGVIVTKDGYILTNNHVVDNADEVKVALQDGREFVAKVIGKDPKTDVAVVKIEARDVPYALVADSDKIEVGDLVLAIGNPFGIGQTVTMGMVSATGRANVGVDYEDFIQTDAAINPGNSGGALVDAEGRLIGINTAILSRSGGNQGIGFAIPVNLAKDVMEKLVQDGKVTRGYVGLMIQDITAGLARQFKLTDNRGALVGDVVAKGPADKAGVKTGDVVMEYAGKPVRDSRQFRLQVARTKPGEKVPVKVLRDGSTKTLEVTIQELPGTEGVAKADREATDTGTLNGVEVANVDAEARRRFNLPENVRGAVVSSIEPDSAAAEAGLRVGDVILEINRQAVKNADEAVRLTEHPKDKTTLLRVWSNGGTRFVVVDEENGK
jgi:serine protease Do